MKSSPRIPLAVMMFLEYAVWGAWTPILSETVGTRLHATGQQLGLMYMMLWIACIITPFIGGQIVARCMHSQVFLGIAHLLGAGAGWMMGNPEENLAGHVAVDDLAPDERGDDAGDPEHH